MTGCSGGNGRRWGSPVSALTWLSEATDSARHRVYGALEGGRFSSAERLSHAVVELPASYSSLFGPSSRGFPYVVKGRRRPLDLRVAPGQKNRDHSRLTPLADARRARI